MAKGRDFGAIEAFFLLAAISGVGGWLLEVAGVGPGALQRHRAELERKSEEERRDRETELELRLSSARLAAWEAWSAVDERSVCTNDLEREAVEAVEAAEATGGGGMLSLPKEVVDRYFKVSFRAISAKPRAAEEAYERFMAESEKQDVRSTGTSSPPPASPSDP